jgi:hypothetical protein
MKVFFFMDRNAETVSGVSWKMWKIERRGREVTVWWGAATIVKRKPKPVHDLQSKPRKFRSEEKAKEFEDHRIKEKLRRGYKRMAKRRR